MVLFLFFFLEKKVISGRFVFCVIEKICNLFFLQDFQNYVHPVLLPLHFFFFFFFNCSMGFVWVSNLNLNLICDYTYILTYIVIYLVSLRNSIIEIHFCNNNKIYRGNHTRSSNPTIKYMHINLTVSIIYYMIVRLIINSP